MSEPRNEHPADDATNVHTSGAPTAGGSADEILTDGTLGADADLSTDNQKKVGEHHVKQPDPPLIPNGGAPIDGTPAGDENDLPVNDPNLDDGETNDSEDTVDEDVREANAVNDNLDK